MFCPKYCNNNILLPITTAPTGGLRPLAATGAEGLKQPSKGSPPLSLTNFTDHSYHYHDNYDNNNDDHDNNYDDNDDYHNNYDDNDEYHNKYDDNDDYHNSYDNDDGHSLRNGEARHALTANDPPIAEKKLMRPLLILSQRSEEDKDHKDHNEIGAMTMPMMTIIAMVK